MRLKPYPLTSAAVGLDDIRIARSCKESGLEKANFSHERVSPVITLSSSLSVPRHSSNRLASADSRCRRSERAYTWRFPQSSAVYSSPHEPVCTVDCAASLRDEAPGALHGVDAFLCFLFGRLFASPVRAMPLTGNFHLHVSDD